MWLRVAAVTPWQLLPERTCLTRVHDGQATRQFPEGGSYDGAMACGAFLNTHTFEQLYPLMDLTVPEQARRVARDALGLRDQLERRAPPLRIQPRVALPNRGMASPHRG